MNTLQLQDDNTYLLTTTNGQTFICKRWFEKKINAWQIKLPDNPSGRKFVKESLVPSDGIYAFEDKTSAPRVLGSSGSSGWKSKMTEDEKVKFEEAESIINSIKEDCMKRVGPAKNTPEWYLQQIELMKEKLEQLKK